MAIVKKAAVTRKPGHLYYVDGKGNVCETKMARGGAKKKKSAPKKKARKAAPKRKAAPRKKATRRTTARKSATRRSTRRK